MCIRDSIDAGLRPHKSNLGVPGDQGVHNLVGPASIYQCQVNALLLEIPQLDSRILGRIEDGVGHLIEGYGGQIFVLGPIPFAAGEGQTGEGEGGKKTK